MEKTNMITKENMKIVKQGGLLLLLLRAFSMHSMIIDLSHVKIEKREDCVAEEPQQRNDPKGKKVGNFYISGHCITRLSQRNVSQEEASWVAGHGNRHITAKGQKLCVDVNKKIGVILDDKTNTIITVFINMDQEALDHWLDMTNKKKKSATRSTEQIKTEDWMKKHVGANSSTPNIKIAEHQDGKTIGKYFYSNIALQRMLERKITPQQAAMIINYDNHYKTYSGAELCVNVGSKYAVLINPKTNNVLSVFRGIDQRKLDDWIIRKDAAIKARQDKKLKNMKLINKMAKKKLEGDSNESFSVNVDQNLPFREYLDLEEKLVNKGKKIKPALGLN